MLRRALGRPHVFSLCSQVRIYPRLSISVFSLCSQHLAVSLASSLVSSYYPNRTSFSPAHLPFITHHIDSVFRHISSISFSFHLSATLHFDIHYIHRIPYSHLFSVVSLSSSPSSCIRHRAVDRRQLWLCLATGAASRTSPCNTLSRCPPHTFPLRRVNVDGGLNTPLCLRTRSLHVSYAFT